MELKLYWIHKFNLSLVDGVILLGEDWLVVPTGLREKFLDALHYTHQGIAKTLAWERSNAFWPGITHDVLKLCRECEICAEDHADLVISVTSHSEAYGPGFKYRADISEIDRQTPIPYCHWLLFICNIWMTPTFIGYVIHHKCFQDYLLQYSDPDDSGHG